MNTKGPSFAGDGTLSNYHDIIEVKSDDHYVLRSEVQGEDGKWRVEFDEPWAREGAKPPDEAEAAAKAPEAAETPAQQSAA